MAGSSPPLENQDARISTEGLTYGVELEFVFAFHEDELMAVLDRDEYGGRCALSKRMSYFDRENPVFTRIPLTETPNRVYNSWGITYRDRATKGRVTVPYQTEPMMIVGTKLSKKCPYLQYQIMDVMTENDKIKDLYNQWIVTRDCSVCGVGSENIPAWLARDNMGDVQMWDSIGIEIVSRVLNSASPEGKQEIARVIDAVKGGSDDSYGAFITNQ
jgi:hypothetical protein